MSYWDTAALVKLYAKEPDTSLFEERLVNLPRPLITSRIAHHARLPFHFANFDLITRFSVPAK